MSIEELAKAFRKYADRAEDTHVNPVEFTVWASVLEPYLPHSCEPQGPVLRIEGVDEYGPRLEWFKHWDELKGQFLYSLPTGKEKEA